MTRRIRSDPASGATVTLCVALRPSAVASRRLITSALSDDGDGRPPRSATNSQSSAIPGTLAISAPTSPIVGRASRPVAASSFKRSTLRLRIGRYM